MTQQTVDSVGSYKLTTFVKYSGFQYYSCQVHSVYLYCYELWSQLVGLILSSNLQTDLVLLLEVNLVLVKSQ